jgi:hypothetical protein
MNAGTHRGYATDPDSHMALPCGSRAGGVPLGPGVPRAHAPYRDRP